MTDSDIDRTIGDDAGPEFTKMGAEVVDRTSLHISVDKTFRFDSYEHITKCGVVRINSEEKDGPIQLKAEFAVDQGIHAVQIVLATKTWYAETYATLEDSRLLRDQLDGAIRGMEMAEAIMANPGRMAEWTARQAASL